METFLPKTSLNQDKKIYTVVLFWSLTKWCYASKLTKTVNRNLFAFRTKLREATNIVPHLTTHKSFICKLQKRRNVWRMKHLDFSLIVIAWIRSWEQTHILHSLSAQKENVETFLDFAQEFRCLFGHVQQWQWYKTKHYTGIKSIKCRSTEIYILFIW